MICNCNELKPWLKEEISYLESLLKKVNSNSKVSNIVEGKIEAYSLILECFENE